MASAPGLRAELGKSKMTKTQRRIANARARLRAAVDRACIARGEAQWTNGYRTGALRYIASDEDNRLYRKEMEQFERCGTAEKTVERLMAAYALAIRRSYNPMKRRAK